MKIEEIGKLEFELSHTKNLDFANELWHEVIKPWLATKDIQYTSEEVLNYGCDALKKTFFRRVLESENEK